METDGVVINGQYRVVKRIGGGSFGDIYMGIGPINEKVAIKFEKQGTKCPQLRHEYKVYRELQNCPGFGNVLYFGLYKSNSVMVMSLHDSSLEDLFTKCGRRFSLKTVLQIGDNMLERMEAMHSQHLVHRDVKPANFVLGLGKNPSVYCIDFGLSTRYRHPRTLQHIPYRENRSLTGTPRYASINNHLGIEQSRRDDLESIGYILIYFLRGSLPWQGIKARNAKKKYRMIMERKQSISVQQLCQGLPHHFATYLNYCRKLGFDEDPNFPYLRGLFHELYRDRRYDTVQNLVWDWTVLNKGENRAGDGHQPLDVHTAPTAKVQDEKTEVQQQQDALQKSSLTVSLTREKKTKSDLQHGGDSAIIERADGYQREAANIETLEKIVPQGQSCLVTSLQKKSSQSSHQEGIQTNSHGNRPNSSSRKIFGPKKTSSCSELLNSTSQISTIHEKNKGSMLPTPSSQGPGTFGGTTPTASKGLIGGMWNLRQYSNAGFWGSHKRGWTSRANPFLSKSKVTSVLRLDSQRRRSSISGSNDSSLEAKKRASLGREYAVQQRMSGKEKDLELIKDNAMCSAGQS